MDESPNWLLVDDDDAFLQVLQRSLKRHGVNSAIAHTPDAAIVKTAEHAFTRCVLDLNLAGESGLRLLPELLSRNPRMKVLVLTGYGSIATAVEAIRRGAVNYLCKPVTATQLIAGFDELKAPRPLRDLPPSIQEMEWEHIQRVLNANQGNVSATARALNMHRRTLQRKLNKHSLWRE
ncbi:response regulator transcription factor [Marinobacter bohaiensis]|uniref:response regulator transcription factor n=1 Tax=Marinobacter bohaiensis TaxID=2201898 RepID=UPI000DAE915B|nr:response regulator [Marinobacter bohaiensis]